MSRLKGPARAAKRQLLEQQRENLRRWDEQERQIVHRIMTGYTYADWRKDLDNSTRQTKGSR